jgi:hypothetical protein
MADTIDEWGGATVGQGYSRSSNTTFPGAHLQATNDHIRLRFLWKRHTFGKTDVSAVRRYDGLLFGRGVQTIHAKPGCPSYVVFYTVSRREAIIEQFRQLGYNVLDGTGKESEEMS